MKGSVNDREMKDKPSVWLYPIKPRNWRIIKKAKLLGFPKAAKKVVNEIKPGDIIVFHVLKPVNGIVAMGTVTSNVFEDYSDIWGTNRYPLRIKIEISDSHTRDEHNPVPISALMGSTEKPEVEIEPYLRNVWIVKITEKQYKNLIRCFSSLP